LYLKPQGAVFSSSFLAFEQPANKGIKAKATSATTTVAWAEAMATSATILQTRFFTADLLLFLVSAVTELHTRLQYRGQFINIFSDVKPQ
jgi:hypothetical protein